jgi:hypothetical protein
MPFTPIRHVQAEKIFKEINTLGSGPLLVMGNDGNTYFCKTTLGQPCVELINEILVANFARCFGLKVPELALVKISRQIADLFVNEIGPFSPRYTKTDFDNSIFFGSERNGTATELEQYIQRICGKIEFRSFENPTDLIKIGVIDLWVGNKDRKRENPNILITANEKGKLNFEPIDHTAAFSFCTNHKEVTPPLLFLEEKFRILNTPLIKSIASFARDKLDSLAEEITQGINNTLENLDWIFDQVPKDWGFSKKAKIHLKAILSDKERNEQIAKSYISYLE